MSLASMTGFARREGGDGEATWAWEAKSVNGRGLDLRLRIPQGMEGLEGEARSLAGKLFRRGNLQIGLTLSRGARPQVVRVNEDLLAQFLALSRDLHENGDAVAPRADGLLSLRGVLDLEEEPESEDALEAREAAILADLKGTLEDLRAGRLKEGARLDVVLRGHLAEIERLTEAAAETAAAQPAALRARIERQVEELLEGQAGLPEERLAQEVALLVVKADVREEIDRLKAHIAQARELLDEGNAVGRRLDFLCQEFNREANTLCSKAAEVELTRLGLALKNAVEQLREQVQNIE